MTKKTVAGWVQTLLCISCVAFTVSNRGGDTASDPDQEEALRVRRLTIVKDGSRRVELSSAGVELFSPEGKRMASLRMFGDRHLAMLHLSAPNGLPIFMAGTSRFDTGAALELRSYDQSIACTLRTDIDSAGELVTYKKGQKQGDRFPPR